MVEESVFRAPAPYVPLPARLGILLSGRGSNFEALADACANGQLPARIGVVVSDRADAAGLEKARGRGLDARALALKDFGTREAHEAALEATLAEAGCDLVCLAGYMRVLSPAFVARHWLRVLNIHPSLLPAFPGLSAQRQALEWGAHVSGATVHFVDPGVDTGPVIEQVPVRVRDDDETADLAARILAEEHSLYVTALGKVLLGGWVLRGRRVVFPSGSVRARPAENPSLEGLPPRRFQG